MNALLDPQFTRRLGVDAKLILLADGQYWGFALATTRLSPIFYTHKLGSDSEESPIGVKSRVRHSYQVERYITLIRDEINTATSSKLWAIFFTMASCLLQESHDVDLVVCKSLLGVEEKELSRLVREILGLFDRETLRPCQA